MEYFRINYAKLQNLKQIKFSIVLIIIPLFILFLIIIANQNKVSKKIETYGIYQDGVLQLQINNELSDIIKSNNTLIFNNKKTHYIISSFENYELIDEVIYQNILLTIDENNFVNNEVGKIELYYDKQKIINYIFELFK